MFALWKKNVVIFLFCCFIGVSGYFVAYYTLTSNNNIEKDSVNDFDVFNSDILPKSDITQVLASDQRVTSSTKFIYRYFYKSSGKYEQLEDSPPYFIIGMNRAQVQDIYHDWSIQSFSPNEIVLLKTMPEDDDNGFVIGVHDGYVTIFYEKELNGNNIYEITDIIVAALPIEEQQKLRNGIHIIDIDELHKILEDYGS